jgi:hypothetical protein
MRSTISFQCGSLVAKWEGPQHSTRGALPYKRYSVSLSLFNTDCREFCQSWNLSLMRLY